MYLEYFYLRVAIYITINETVVIEVAKTCIPVFGLRFENGN